MADVASSRIFVKGLPPTFSDAEFRKHFAQNGREITDAKIFPNRRIGYVGYKTPEDAQKAVKYFNKTFIRMSRIGVELARPIQDCKTGKQTSSAPTARRHSGGVAEIKDDSGVKRKRESFTKEEQDPKLKEFLDAYKPKSKKKAWEAEEPEPIDNATSAAPDAEAAFDAFSDEEYEEVPKKKRRRSSEQRVQQEAASIPRSEPEKGKDGGHEQQETADHEISMPDAQESPVDQPAVSDSDWARSRTSRLLGLLDDDEEEATTVRRHDRASSDVSEAEAQEVTKGVVRPQKEERPASLIPTPPSDHDETAAKKLESSDENTVRSSMRLFIRNLPYDVQREDLSAEFEQFGHVDEVSHYVFHSTYNLQ